MTWGPNRRVASLRAIGCVLVLVGVLGCAPADTGRASISVGTAPNAGAPSAAATATSFAPTASASAGASSSASASSSPAPSSEAPGHTPAASWGTTPGSARPRLGAAGEAVVFVKRTDTDTYAVSGEVYAFGVGGTARKIARIAQIGRSTSGDRWAPSVDGGRPALSDRGFLLFQMTRRADTDPDRETGEVEWWLYDLNAPAAPPHVVPMTAGAAPVWGPDGRLLIVDGSAAQLYDAVTGAVSEIERPPDVQVLPGWTADGRGFYATKADGTTDTTIATGVLGLDGTFHAGPVSRRYDGWADQGATGETIDVTQDDSGADIGVRSFGASAATSWYRWKSTDADVEAEASWDARLSGLWIAEPAGDGVRLVHVTAPAGSTVVPLQDPLPLASLEGVSGDGRTLALQELDGSGAILVVDTVSGESARYEAEVSDTFDALTFLGWASGGQ